MVEVAGAVAHEVARDGDADGHDGLEQDGLGLLHAVLEGGARGDLEGDFGGVDFVVGAVVDGDHGVDDGVAGDGALEHAVDEALFDGRQEVARDAGADDAVDEPVLGAFGLGLDAEVDFAVLAAAAGLLLVLVVAFALGGDGFLVGDLGDGEVDFDLAAGLHALHGGVDLDVADAGDDQLVGLVVALDLDGRVVGRDALQAWPSLSSSPWFLGVTAKKTTGFGKTIGAVLTEVPGEQRVSLRSVFLSLARAMMSPAEASGTVSWRLPLEK